MMIEEIMPYIWGLINSIIVYYTTSKALNAYTLHRDSKPQNISKVILPKELKIEVDEIDLERLKKQKYGKELLKFVEVMVNNFPKEDLINFYNNINTLKVKEKSFDIGNFLFKAYTAGQYNPKKNVINLEEKYAIISIYHELFHMASAIAGTRIVGFHQSEGSVSIGKGLNEGYTELLCRRYFGPGAISLSYEFSMYAASQIEDLVGKDKMQSLYFRANLKGLIDELKKYASEEDIMKFINDTDFVIEHLEQKKVPSKEKKLLNKAMHDVNAFLVKCKGRKILKQHLESKGAISQKDCSMQLAKYVVSLPYKVRVCKNEYIIMSNEDIDEYVKLTFDLDDIRGLEENKSENRRK